MSQLLAALKTTQNVTFTENGAVSNTSTFSDILDFFYHAPARRGKDNTGLFSKAMAEDHQTAVRALFYIRDIRGGQGERETFRQGLRFLVKNYPAIFNAVISLVPEYGRWDDVIEYTYNQTVVDLVGTQLTTDLKNLVSEKSVSLLAKWLPSVNTSSKKTVAMARQWVRALGMTEKEYRQALSMLRAKIDVTEIKLSSKAYTAVNYSTVPSKASLRYRAAFRKHDGDRYMAFLESAMRGEVKINSSTLYPYDLVSKYLESGSYYGDGTLDMTVEAQWKQLPNYADTDVNALVVCDTSGSMFSGGNGVMPASVALSLAIYIAERNKGIFKDHFFTFSEAPTLQQIKGVTLLDRVNSLKQSHWGMNTDLQAVFTTLLATAVKNRISESEMPSVLFVVSDMEFDACCDTHTNFQHIASDYTRAGYSMPKLVFWNVASRKTQTPVTMDEKGTYLVSGCSPSIFQKAINTQATTPYEMMTETLFGSRYALLGEALKTVC